MGSDRAYDLEETMRNPLELTCCLPLGAAEVAALDDDPRPTRLLEKRRPERVFVRPVHQPQPQPQKKAPEPWRPAPRARPTPPRGVPVARRQVLPRASTVPSHPEP